MKRAGILLLLLALIGADAPVTMQDIENDLYAAKFQDVVRKATQALAIKGQAAAALDRVELFELKGEAHLQLKQNVPAADAFASAAKEATDEKQIARDKATSVLIKRSAGGKYQPRQPSTQPAGGKADAIDIVDPQSRKGALAALYNDEVKPAQVKSETLKKATTLKPLFEAVTELSDLRALEMAATGADATSKQIISGLGDHANTLMQDSLKTMTSKVDEIQKRAESLVSDRMSGTRRTQRITQKRGLTSVDAAALRDAISTSKTIASASDEFAKALGPAGTAMAATKTTADALAKRADDVLNADYSTKADDVIDPANSGNNNRPPPHK